MKNKILILLIASSLLLTACFGTSTETDTDGITGTETSAPVTDAQTEDKMELTYYVRSPYNTEDTQKGEYTTLEEAKAQRTTMHS